MGRSMENISDLPDFRISGNSETQDGRDIKENLRGERKSYGNGVALAMPFSTSLIITQKLCLIVRVDLPYRFVLPYYAFRNTDIQG